MTGAGQHVIDSRFDRQNQSKLTVHCILLNRLQQITGLFTATLESHSVSGVKYDKLRLK